ncbi:MAG TPA: chromosome segregation protein SMC [Thermoanaerobaculia bacterium]|nr:chromosome segregation protein SMC [Thermoanaerobaculia bacterium]
MFRLEKLDISGFKSFYDPAQLLFPAPLTAVVGPNGCGKSNICDAIIWVLGENRASHIRGETMEDVIFQGSARRRPLGMGEVTLTLSTDNGHPAADDGKITINRRVFRSGESEFRLNGKRVRLKDISDILMDTGLGIRNYSVMEQGKIDLILSHKPQDRRRLIEEAAGITRYKTKRRAAELKLEETQANLLRIDDTLAEVTRNLNSLKRQAGKARRHKELIDQLSGAKRSLYAGRIISARSELEASETGVAETQNREGAAAALLASQEAALAESRARHSERTASASMLREENSRLSSESERLRSFLQQAENNLKDLDGRLEISLSRLEEMKVEHSEQQQLLSDKEISLEQARAERNRIRQSSDELEQVRQQSADSLRQGERVLTESRETLMRTIARIAEARNQVHQIEIAVEKCEFYLAKLGDAKKKVSDNRNHALERVSDWNEQVRAAESALSVARQEAQQAVEQLDSLQKRRESVRGSLSSSRDVISQTTYKIDSLRTILTSLESQDEEVRRVILEMLPNAVSAAESVRGAEGFEAALDVLLREISKAVVVADSGAAIELIGRLREQGAGRGAFIALDYLAEGEGARRGNAADVILGDGAVADAIRASVPEAYIVGDLTEALSNARQRPHTTFLTREGDIVRGPFILGGHKQSAQPGIFSIKRQIRDLEHILGAEEARAGGIAAELHTLEEDVRAADDARILTEERARTSEQELRDKASGRDRVVTDLQRFETELAVSSEEELVYDEEKVQLLERRTDAIAELRRLEASEQSTHATIRDTEESVKSDRAGFEVATERASNVRVELETASGTVNAAQREQENLARVASSLTTRINQLQSEIESISVRRTETASQSESARAQLEDTLTYLAEIGERRVSIEAEVSDLQTRVAQLESEASTARTDWNSGRETLFEAGRRLDRARSAFELLREQVLLDLHAGLEALSDVEPPADEQRKGELESEVARLADQLEKIGPVNVLAIEEHQELEERETFLRTQRNDLVEAIDSLRGTIRKINVTSRELFREAFAAINHSFSDIFVALFGGGTAGMQLLDEDDLLESGIELIAQPPGKKTQSISLLSGGERALTALALLFAIFRYKPSPFCILDEVDAPLDEVNNERFVRLVRDMSRETQFIVITHSRRTMEAADVLYGVTMEEAGCSRLVSVSFEQLEA